MAQPQHRAGMRITMFARCCVAWIILLGVSPLAVPFTVSETHSVVRPQATTSRPAPSRRNELAGWGLDDMVIAELPLLPLATEVAATSPPNAVDRTVTLLPRHRLVAHPPTPPIRIPLALRV
jgi:hypothetical protein